MVNSESTRSYMGSLDTAKKSLNWIFLTAVIFNYTLSDQMIKYMMFLIRPLQLILHLPLFRVVMPSNFVMLNSIIAPIMMFDVLDNDFDIDINLIMSYDENQKNGPNILDQMKNIGYEDSNCSKNLGTMYFFIVLYFIQVVFTVFLAIFKKLTGKG